MDCQNLNIFSHHNCTIRYIYAYICCMHVHHIIIIYLPLVITPSHSIPAEIFYIGSEYTYIHVYSVCIQAVFIMKIIKAHNIVKLEHCEQAMYSSLGHLIMSGCHI